MHFLPFLLFSAAAFAKSCQAKVQEGILVADMPDGAKEQVYIGRKRTNHPCFGPRPVATFYITTEKEQDAKPPNCLPTFKLDKGTLFYQEGDAAVISAFRGFDVRTHEGGDIFETTVKGVERNNPGSSWKVDDDGYLKFFSKAMPQGKSRFCMLFERGNNGKVPVPRPDPACADGARLRFEPLKNMRKCNPDVLEDQSLPPRGITKESYEKKENTHLKRRCPKPEPE